MRAVLVVFAAFAVMGLAIWAYQTSQATQEARAEWRALRSEIRSLSEALAVQRAEWAYLNSPHRLRQLAEINFPRLGLLPMEGVQFGQIDEVPYPMLLAAPVTETTP